MSRLRVAFFGMSGPLSLGALGAIGAEHTVAAVVQPAARRSGAGQVRSILGGLARAVGLSRPGSLGELQRRYRFPIWAACAGADPDIAARLEALRPDLICIAGYPWILPPELLGAAPLGTINLHAALLPRHRGLLPLFWIYYRDDRETGVTVHRATAIADAGEILGQASFALERGLPVDRLNQRNGEMGATLMASVLRDLAGGQVQGRPQDESLATLAPGIRPGVAMVDFSSWDVERVWHFLAGLYPRFQEPIMTPEGIPVRYGGVRGYLREQHRHPPGTVLRAPDSWDLYCNGGRVQLAVGA